MPIQFSLFQNAVGCRGWGGFWRRSTIYDCVFPLSSSFSTNAVFALAKLSPLNHFIIWIQLKNLRDYTYPLFSTDFKIESLSTTSQLNEYVYIPSRSQIT